MTKSFHNHRDLFSIISKMKWLLLSLLLRQALSAPLDDLVESLPDYGRPPTPFFSGYLDGTDGCDTDVNGEYCKLHYWLALAEEDPMQAPTVLWLNGGPGSSSILGFLQENGPVMMNASGLLMDNPWSWTKAANLLALEAPVGVGYSYCANQVKGELCQNTDKFTASTSRAALVDFFTNKFPELAGGNFFITGESYAGVYIPTLSKELLDHASDSVNLVGIAVGDPCTDNDAQKDSMDSLWYGHKYGLVDDQVFDVLWNKCNARFPNLMTKGGKHFVASKLNQHLESMNILLSTEQSKEMGPNKLKEHASKLLQELKNDPGASFNHEDNECQLAYYKYIMSSSKGLSQGWGDLYIDDYSLFAPVSSQEDLDMAVYMSRADVREALHVAEAPTTTWPYADVGFDYTSEYDACNDEFEEGAWSMIDFYKDIVPRLKVTWIYNGDTDPCVSYEGTRTAVKRIGLNELDGGSYRPWFYNQTAAPLNLIAEKAPLFGPNLLPVNMGAQFGGEIVNYEEGLAFLTFHGSGHMVPQFRPQSALHMLEKLIKCEDLSPLMPPNATLAAMQWGDFKAALDQWTESAMGPPYVSTKKGKRDDLSVMK